MRDGATYVYQAAFVDGNWRGFADFLERQPDGAYEALDTKLARHAKPDARAPALLLHRADRADPGRDARARCTSSRARRARELPAARLRRLLPPAQRRFLEVVERGGDTYPYPVEHCGLCDFLRLCEERWGDDDHLVARRGHRRDSRSSGSPRAGSRRSRRSASRRRARGSRRSARRRSRRCATRRRSSSTTARPASTASSSSRSRRTAASRCCRSRRPGDIWLDLEGDPLFEPARGLEYLLRLGRLDEDGEPRYECLWAQRPRRGEARVRAAVDSSSSAGAASRACTSTTTRPTSAPRSRA